MGFEDFQAEIVLVVGHYQPEDLGPLVEVLDETGHLLLELLGLQDVDS